MNAVEQIKANVQDALATIWHYKSLVAVVFVLLAIGSYFIANSIPSQYAAGANLLVVNGTTRDDPTLSSSDLPSIATSTVVLSRMERSLGLTIPLTVIKHGISIKAPAFRSGILRIEYTSADPNQAMLIANSVADELIKYYRQISTARYDDDLRALDDEMSKQRDLTHFLNDKVRASGVVGIAADKALDTSATRIGDLEMNAALAGASLKADTASYDAMKTNVEHQQTMVRAEVLKADPTYQNLQTSVAATATQLANTRAAFTPDYPGLPGLTDKVKSLQGALAVERQRALSSSDAFSPSLSIMLAEQRRAGALIEADRAKSEAINSLLANERVRSGAFPTVEALRLERDAAQASFLSLAGRRATALANRADALSLGSVVVVDRAIVSDARIGLGKSKLLLLLGLLVLVLAVVSAFIADKLNPRLVRTSQVEDLYGQPVIATMGHK